MIEPKQYAYAVLLAEPWRQQDLQRKLNSPLADALNRDYKPHTGICRTLKDRTRKGQQSDENKQRSAANEPLGLAANARLFLERSIFLCEVVSFLNRQR